jgi:AAA+ superfamily predicted ATPase
VTGGLLVGDKTIYSSITEALEAWFKKTGEKAEFKLAPLTGKLYVIRTEEVEIKPEPPKRFNIMVTTTRDHTLLVEKHRPTTLEGYVGNENIKNSISQYLSQNDIQNLIFYGPSGTGKTTLAKLIVNNLNCDYLYINASDERGIETIRDKVAGFASSASFKPLKVVILDEADFLTIQAQASLRNVIETFSRNTRLF